MSGINNHKCINRVRVWLYSVISVCVSVCHHLFYIDWQLAHSFISLSFCIYKNIYLNKKESYSSGFLQDALHVRV